MSTTAATSQPGTGATGTPVEVGRYTLPDGTARVLYAQRIIGSVRLSDHPATESGRRYLIERELEYDGQNAHAALRALVADYLCQAGRHGEIPMQPVAHQTETHRFLART